MTDKITGNDECQDPVGKIAEHIYKGIINNTKDNFALTVVWYRNKKSCDTDS